MEPKTKLEHWCEGVIEAGWLAALVVAPMFFNVFSSRVFEPDKISLVRSIALIMLAAWLSNMVAGGQPWLPAFLSDPSDSGNSDSSNSAQDDSADGGPRSLLRQFVSIPFLLPIFFLIIAYLLSTAFSVARFVSWWGSYQRLQGTYTFLSYVIIALLTMGHLRRPDQIRRLQHVIIMTSLPIAVYGVIQHYGIDPLPWGGDVSIRIAGNAGNAIFLAAYLIMALFFTMERIYSCFHFMLTAGNDAEDRSDSDTMDLPSAVAGGAYLFIFLVQLLAIYWTQSRGPWLGLFLGIYLFILLLIGALRPKNHRLFTLGWVGIGVLGIALLVAMNTMAVFAPLGRLTELLDFESRTAKVRTLIWTGAADMSQPHEALIFPDGNTDTINAMRPLVGYGPEAMWIAYNPFYPPELAHWEARNASPDRAHNETWDSIVVTGMLGFFAYMSLFIAIFYWALRWLGLIINRFDTILFSALLGVCTIGGIALAYMLDGQQWRLLGVALPAGLMFGIVVYLMLASFLHTDFRPNPADMPRQLLLVALISTFAAHFIEIHFGIAIAATRTYFWISTALLLVLGMRWAKPLPFAATQFFTNTDLPTEAADPEGEEEQKISAKSGSKNKGNAGKSRGKKAANRNRRGRASTRPDKVGALPTTVMTDLLIFLTFVFIYTTNAPTPDGQRSGNPLGVLGNSIAGETPAILLLIVFTWLIGSTLSLAVRALRQEQTPPLGWWLRGYGLYAVVVWGGWLIYGIIQATRLGPVSQSDIPRNSDILTYQLDLVAGHFAVFTWIVVIWIVGSALVYAWPWLVGNASESAKGTGSNSRLLIGAGASVILGILILFIINNVNIGLVKADIIYKQGQQFDSRSDWPNSIELYRRALRSRTTEDHYMLFLGRSLLEQAKAAPDQGTVPLGGNLDFRDVLDLQPAEVQQMGKQDLLRAAEIILLEAQSVNPLNTDHTANRARLYRTWADMESDEAVKQEKLDQSLEQYIVATTLSPNAAHLWNEKGNAHQARRERDLAEETYLHSLSIDPLFEQTYLLLAQLYGPQQEPQKVVDLLGPGVETLKESRRHRPSTQIYSIYGVALAQLRDYEGAIEANNNVLAQQPNNFAAIRNLAVLYRDAGQLDQAVESGEKALTVLGVDDVRNRLSIRQFLVEQYRALEQNDRILEQYEQMHVLAPEDGNILRSLNGSYLSTENHAKLIETGQKLMVADPNNFQYPLQIARSLLALGQTEQARQFAEQAQRLAPADQQETINALLSEL